jgi:aspartate kinase
MCAFGYGVAGPHSRTSNRTEYELMALIVQKYGGTSVGDLERIANVARKVAATKDKGNEVVVVVSAMAGETDRLIGLAKKISPLPNEREMDVLVSTGEQVSIALLAITLESMGYKARSYCGWQIPLVTNEAYGAARVTSIEKESILEDIKNGYIIVVAGFQGVDNTKRITTLGRQISARYSPMWTAFTPPIPI